MNWKLLIALFLTHLSFSQVEVGLLYEEMPNDSIEKASITNHSSIRPFIRTTNLAASAYSSSVRGFKDTVPKLLITPIFDAGIKIDNELSSRTGLGVSLSSIKYSKWYYKFSVIEGFGETKNDRFQPKAFIFQPKTGDQFIYTDIRGRASYTPNKVFNFQAGIDHNFIGEGNRSLFLSDYGKPYPFAKIRAAFWKVEYMMLYQFFREETTKKEWKSKYAATHLISYNPTKWLNFGIFESVVFAPKDTNLNRGFDAEYLNPIVFFRPQEYSLGSSDNVVLGALASIKIKQHAVYSQVVIDDFDVNQIKNRTQWWANKYGAQLGVKGRFKYTNKNFFYRCEFNFTRPYTYSHKTSSQNYANQGYALAHPYGSNFYEILGELKWQNKKWIVKVFANYFMHGADKKDGLSYGGDIYASYDIRPYEFGNTIGQGIKNNGVRLMFTTSYLLDKGSNLQVFMEHQLRANTSYSQPVYQIVVGLRSCLWNDYRNY